MPDSMNSCMMHILLIQECDDGMSSRLIIDGNAVYEIDEECAEAQKKKTGRFAGGLGGTAERGQQEQRAGSTGTRDS